MGAGGFVSTGYNDWFTIPNLSVSAADGFNWTTGVRGMYP